MSRRSHNVTLRRTSEAVARPAPILHAYPCRCRDDEFVVIAPNYGSAWSRVMERYGVEHPSAIPRPVYMPNATATSGGTTRQDDNPTVQAPAEASSEGRAAQPPWHVKKEQPR